MLAFGHDRTISYANDAVEQPLHIADEELYRAKAAGRNGYRLARAS